LQRRCSWLACCSQSRRGREVVVEGPPAHLLGSVGDASATSTARDNASASPHGFSPVTCPVRSLEAWTDAFRGEQGPVFRPVDRDDNIAARHLSDRAVAEIIKRRAHAAGHTSTPAATRAPRCERASPPRQRPLAPPRSPSHDRPATDRWQSCAATSARAISSASTPLPRSASDSDSGWFGPGDHADPRARPRRCMVSRGRERERLSVTPLPSEPAIGFASRGSEAAFDASARAT
jgi:hypothetical protein